MYIHAPRLWAPGIPTSLLTFTSVFIKLSMRTTTGTPDFWGKNSISPESLLATKPLTKDLRTLGTRLRFAVRFAIACVAGVQSGGRGEVASHAKPMRARSATIALRARIQLPPSLPFVRRPRRLDFNNGKILGSPPGDGKWSYVTGCSACCNDW